VIAAFLLAAQAAVVPPDSPAWVTIPREQLRERYDTLWAVSDVHGRLRGLERLLSAAGLVDDEVRWRPARQLLIVTGDVIDGGPDSVATVLLLHRLQAEAAAADSRVVLLVGNHEADFLARPRRASAELLESARRAGIATPPGPSAGETLAAGAFGDVVRGWAAGASIGPWLVAHAGYLDARDSDGALRGWFADLDRAWRNGEQYRWLRDDHSIVAFHGWWASARRRDRMRAHLARLGLDAVAFGHDPAALGAAGTIAHDESAQLIKLDTGMKSRGSAGMLLRCSVAAWLDAAARDRTFACRRFTRDGDAGGVLP
jgi:hypothetical protein